MSATLQFIILFALSHKQVYGQALVDEPGNLYVADTVKLHWHRRTSKSTMVFDALLSSESGQDRFVKPFVTRTLKIRTVIVPQQQTASQYLATTMGESRKSIDSTESPKISYGRPKTRQPESEPFNRRKTRMIKASRFPKDDRQSEWHVFFRRAAVSGNVTSNDIPGTTELNQSPSNGAQSTRSYQSNVTQQMTTTITNVTATVTQQMITTTDTSNADDAALYMIILGCLTGVVILIMCGAWWCSVCQCCREKTKQILGTKTRIEPMQEEPLRRSKASSLESRSLHTPLQDQYQSQSYQYSRSMTPSFLNDTPQSSFIVSIEYQSPGMSQSPGISQYAGVSQSAGVSPNLSTLSCEGSSTEPSTKQPDMPLKSTLRALRSHSLGKRGPCWEGGMTTVFEADMEYSSFHTCMDPSISTANNESVKAKSIPRSTPDPKPAFLDPKLRLSADNNDGVIAESIPRSSPGLNPEDLKRPITVVMEHEPSTVIHELPPDVFTQL